MLKNIIRRVSEPIDTAKYNYADANILDNTEREDQEIWTWLYIR
jgi:hypothetical protein